MSANRNAQQIWRQSAIDVQAGAGPGLGRNEGAHGEDQHEQHPANRLRDH